MNTNLDSSAQLCLGILENTKNRNLKSTVLVCPPFINLGIVSSILNNSNINLGAQNCWYEEKGAFTGEISAEMLKSIGCTYVIVGHSERRTIFGESDEVINKKAKALLKHGIKPIICIGETLEERNSGNTYKVLFCQLDNSFAGFSNADWENIVIAYEPVWAIGTGVTATPEQAQEAHYNIRKYINEKFGETASKSLILYGGSMNEKNAYELLGLDDVNGGLIGGAALKVDSFVSIIESAEKILSA